MSEAERKTQEPDQSAAVAQMAAAKAAGKPIVGILMWSGGLDSTLARHILLKACPDLKLHTFTVCSPFWKTKHQADIMVDIEDSYYDVLRHPKHNRGRGYNPCTDCHTYMLKRAKAMMQELGASFVATGEVLGQRPNSQVAERLPMVEKDSGLDGLLVRPLSAKLLPETIPEKAGLLNRNAFEAISGRSRHRQLELVKEFGIAKYPSPGGGCWLTVPEIASKIRTIVEGRAHVDKRMFQLLPHARFFHRDGVFIFLGRNYEDNKFLQQFVAQSPAEAGYRIVQQDEIGVPLVVVQSQSSTSASSASDSSSGCSSGATGGHPELTPAVAAYVKELITKYSKPKHAKSNSAASSTSSQSPAAAAAPTDHADGDAKST